ncbi:methyl-accepting chemotaxis protein [Clostridia bacterium OttesenSCG-928-F22]|nr:methyl-accepting chemotaxis protein [Clostridia bacterium OttesenSCG-928-F22]
MSFALYSTSYNIILTNTTDNAFGIAESLANSIDAEQFKQIQTPEDETTEAYLTIQTKLATAREVAGCRFVFTMRKDASGDFVYVVDGSEGEYFSSVGDVEEYAEAYDTVWEGVPSSDGEITYDEKWGHLTSAFYPIKDSTGETVGFVGVDYDAYNEYQGLQRFQTYAVIISAAGILVCLLLGVILANSITKPIRATAHLAQALASGNLDESITVKSQNEIGQLAEILDKNVRHAFKDIEHTRLITEKQSLYQKTEVQKVLANLKNLSEGKLSCDMVVSSCDEDTQELSNIYHEIANNLTSATSTIKGFVGEIAQVLTQVSLGDLSQYIQNDYKGDFIVLKDSINQIIQNMSATFSEITSASQQVAAASTQVADGSQQIAHGATEQASSIDQLTISMTHITTQTEQNAVAANETFSLANNIKSDATHGNDMMKELQLAMQNINESATGIEKIIKVIDDIAFQTNILALNAAVEAARAGVHGKGFAVVAEEVRNLATKSAEAAKETTVLIEESVNKTKTGTQIADETATMLKKITQGIEEAEQLIQNISMMSDSQAQEIAQVNIGIGNVADIVQANAAASEETAATSEELSSQAELLKSMVSRFKL